MRPDASDRIATLIVDDEPPARAGLRQLLAADPEIEVVGECADGISAADALQRLRPRLAFVDVEMPGANGLEVVRRLAAATGTVVVFVTAYSRFAVEAFELEAADYLLKPFDDRRFQQALARAKRRVGEGDAGVERLVVRDPGRREIVETDAIDWIGGAGNYAELHVGPRRHLLRESLNSLADRLPARRFVRIHRSIIVNVARVRQLEPLGKGEYRLRLADGVELRSSRRYRDRLGAAFELSR